MKRVPILLIICLLTGAWTHGSAVLSSKRGVLNVNQNEFINDYAFINFFQEGSSVLAPFGAAWSSGTVWNSAILDANGYPCTNQINAACPFTSVGNPANGRAFGGGISFPAAASYSGNYCFQGYGSGSFQLNSGTWTVQSSQTCGNYSGNCTTGNVVTNSNGHWTTTDETWAGWCIAISLTGAIQQGGNWEITADDPSSSGHYIKGLALYQQSDSTDFVAGKLFRAAYKTPIVSLDPSAIRTMNWEGGGPYTEMSFLTRPLPQATLGYTGEFNPLVGTVPYGATTGTNQLTVASATGMPVAMTHGEVVHTRFTSTSTTGTPSNVDGSFAQTVSAVTQVGSTVTVTTAAPHGFADGDLIILMHDMSASQGFTIGAGIANLAYYQTTINTSGCGTSCYTFTYSPVLAGCASTGACAAVAVEMYTMNVGGRGAYPIMRGDGSLPYSFYFTFTAGKYQGFCFDKNVPGQQDGNGNWIYGVWIVCAQDNAGGVVQGVPLEIITAFVNELNAMSPVYPISLWICIPPMAMVCNNHYCDPDTNSANEWPLNAVKTIFNGANGYAGLTAKAQLIVQFGNELWNTATVMPLQLAFRGWLRWGGSATDYNSFSELLSLWALTDVKGYNFRTHVVDAGWAVQGAGAGTYNYQRITGIGLNASFAADPANPVGAAAPITYYDAFAIAPYFNVSSATYTTDIGTNLAPGTIVSSWITDVQANGLASSQALADIQSFVTAITTDATTGDSINNLETSGAALATLTSGYSKPMINYEGGWNTVIVVAAYVTNITCSSGTVTVTVGNAYSTNEYVELNNTSVAAYNGVWQVASASSSQFTFATTCTGSPAANYQGLFGYATPATNGFLWHTAQSTAWATAQLGFFQNWVGNQWMNMPGTYVEIGTINNPTFGFAYPDTFGATTTEGNGLYPAWTSLATFNRANR